MVVIVAAAVVEAAVAAAIVVIQTLSRSSHDQRFRIEPQPSCPFSTGPNQASLMKIQNKARLRCSLSVLQITKPNSAYCKWSTVSPYFQALMRNPCAKGPVIPSRRFPLWG